MHSAAPPVAAAGYATDSQLRHASTSSRGVCCNGVTHLAQVKYPHSVCSFVLVLLKRFLRQKVSPRSRGDVETVGAGNQGVAAEGHRVAGETLTIIRRYRRPAAPTSPDPDTARGLGHCQPSSSGQWQWQGGKAWRMRTGEDKQTIVLTLNLNPCKPLCIELPEAKVYPYPDPTQALDLFRCSVVSWWLGFGWSKTSSQQFIQFVSRNTLLSPQWVRRPPTHL